MLSILHPEIMAHLYGFNYGLMPVYMPQEDRFILVIKITKEGILAAKINNSFKIYLISDPRGKGHLGLVIAFFDDHDEPLTITTPLFSDDQMLVDIKRLISQESFDIYFFDENNFEFLGASAKNNDFKSFSRQMNDASFPIFQGAEILETWKKINKIFSLRTKEDDAKAYEIDLSDRLYSDDVIITDLRESFSGFNDSAETLAVTTLERYDDPGPMQERDVALLLRRVFDGNDIYLNPYRMDTKKELSDLLVVTNSVLFFVQAKDSPNTEDMLNRPLNRKRKTIQGHIKKAVNQMRGALIYARDNQGVTILSNNKSINIPLEGKQIVGLILVKELFDDDYLACSAPVLELVRELEFPVNLLDYPQLNVLTQKLSTSASFIDGLYEALDMALEHDQFPKSVWSGPPHQKFQN